MIFRIRPLRPEGEPSRTGEATLGRLPGSEIASKTGMRVPREIGENPGSDRAGVQPMTGREGGSPPGHSAGEGNDSGQSGLSPPESAKSAPENAPKPQPSSDDGVPEDMATLVLDNAALGQGQIVRPDPEIERSAVDRHFAASDPASDAAIMLRVAAGDESGFTYLVEKYHRAMVHFLFRMVRNQAVAEELAQEVFLRVYRSREVHYLALPHRH